MVYLELCGHLMACCAGNPICETSGIMARFDWNVILASRDSNLDDTLPATHTKNWQADYLKAQFHYMPNSVPALHCGIAGLARYGLIKTRGR
jgi:hypothetical protein